MSARKILVVTLAAILATATVASSTWARGGKKKSGPQVVGTDPDNDWGANVDPTIQPLGEAAGMELVEASIGMADKETVNFIIKVAALPPVGGTPEVPRYSWDFIVDGGPQLELDGKFTNYSRGACDPTSGQCPPPRDPGMQPFLVRGECGPHPTIPSFNSCIELALVHATFDAAAGTITIPVPLEAIGAKPGSKIVGGINATYGTTVNAIASAFVSSGNFPLDSLITTGTFVVPRGKK